MSALFCRDEGCPQHGTVHICINQHVTEEAETIECGRCGEIVALDEQEQGMCLFCCEVEHEKQERTY